LVGLFGAAARIRAWVTYCNIFRMPFRGYKIAGLFLIKFNVANN